MTDFIPLAARRHKAGEGRAQMRRLLRADIEDMF